MRNARMGEGSGGRGVVKESSCHIRFCCFPYTSIGIIARWLHRSGAAAPSRAAGISAQLAAVVNAVLSTVSSAPTFTEIAESDTGPDGILQALFMTSHAHNEALLKLQDLATATATPQPHT